MKLLGSRHFPFPARILFIQPRRIGDVLLTTPAVRAVAAHFPDAQIGFAVEQPADEALWGNPHIARLHVTPPSPRLREWLRLVHEVRRLRYDWAIDFFSNPRSAQLALLTGAPVRVGLDRLGRRWAYTHRMIEEPEDATAYAVDWRLSVLKLMGVPARGRELEVFSDFVDKSEAERALATLAELPGDAPLVCVHAGNENPAKFYPPDLYAQVVRELCAAGLRVLVTSGPQETRMAAETIRLAGVHIPHLREARVPALAALYRRAALFVGPDSAPKHVAVACGLPTVTFFGPGRPENWCDMHDSRHTVLAAPCDIRPHCTTAECVRRACLRKIAPTEIVNAVRLAIHR